MSINSLDLRYSDELARRDIPSFIEQPPPLIQNPFMKPRPEKGINLLEKFDENSDIEDETELVQVYLRVKPCESPSHLYEIRSDKCFITSLDTTTAGHGRRTQHNVSKMYTFTRIFKPECSQKEIFEQVVKDNLKKLVDGHSFTLLTYGASGSGKTHTVIGTVNAPGLVPRSLEYLFKLVDAAQMPIYMPTDSGVKQLELDKQNIELKWVKRIRQLSANCPIRDKYRRMSAQLQTDLTISNVDLSNRTKYYVWVSFVEIYNENIYDLLRPPEKRTKLQIREDASGNVYVKGVNQAFVRSAEEAYDVMVAGKQNLIVAATGVHKQSSRSHCIFTITMLTENDGEIRSSQVRLCDLAGCERQKAAENTGARMQESRAINSSLHVLERCLHMLRRKQRLPRDTACVPYRESKLTRLLGAGLSGARGEAVSMVVTLNPARKHVNQTKHVLALASVAKDIQVNNTMAMSTFSSLESMQESSISSSDEVMRLRAENERLHFEQLQAMNTIAKLQFHIDEKQQESANTMRELVEETRESMTAFYETRLAAVERQKKDMEEEYESILAEKEHLIAKLRRELKEKEAYIQEHIRSHVGTVSETRRATDESLVSQPKQNYIEAKDVSTDTSDSDDDLEISLNPVHRRTIDAIMSEASVISKCFQKTFEEKDNLPETEVPSQKQPIIDLNESNDEDSKLETESENESNNVNIQTKTTEDNFADNEDNCNDDANNSKDDDQKSKDSLYTTGDEDSDIEQSKQDTGDLTSNLTHTTFEKVDNTHQDDDSVVNDYENDRSEFEQSFNVSIRVKKPQAVNVTSNVRGTYFVSDSKEDESENCENAAPSIRGTYFVNDSEDSNTNKKRKDVHELKAVNNLRGSYVVAERDVSFYKEVNITDQSEKEKESDPEISEMKDKSPEKKQMISETKPDTVNKFVKPKEKVVNKVLRSLKDRKSSNSSLKQFEQIESDINAEDSSENDKINSTFVTNAHLPTLKEKKSYFDDSMQVEVSDATTEKSDIDGRNHDNNKKSKYFEDSLDVVKPSLVCSGKLCLLSSAAKAQEQLLLVTPHNETISTTRPTKHTSLLRTPRETEANIYFGDSDKVRPTDVLLSKSPSLVRDDECQDYVPSIAVKKILGQNFTRTEVLTAAQKDAPKRNESVDVFEFPLVNLRDKPTENNHLMPKIVSTKEPANNEISNKPFPNVKERTVEIARQFVEGLVESHTNKEIVIKQEKISLERTSFTQHSTESIKEESNIVASNTKQLIGADIVIKIEPPSFNNTQTSNNTVDEFEKIVNDLTNVRATEFDLLLSETENNAETTKDQNIIPNEIHKVTEVLKENLEISKKETTNVNNQTEISERTKRFEEVKYNLRNKGKSIYLNSSGDKNQESDKSLENDKPKNFTKRTLRLRRRQNQNEPEECDSRKLKDIRNLEKEFSDVTLGVPAEKKVVKDIPSPEKVPGEEENLPPIIGIQSCPSKSVTRSRRKLFTPRAEALEESPSQAGDSNERVYVPRPSYHRARARRKL